MHVKMGCGGLVVITTTSSGKDSGCGNSKTTN